MSFERRPKEFDISNPVAGGCYYTLLLLGVGGMIPTIIDQVLYKPAEGVLTCYMPVTCNLLRIGKENTEYGGRRMKTSEKPRAKVRIIEMTAKDAGKVSLCPEQRQSQFRKDPAGVNPNTCGYQPADS